MSGWRRAGGPVLAVVVAVSLSLAACGSDGAKSAEPTLSPAAKQGKEVVASNGCQGCHTVDGSRSTGPTWKGLAGSTVKLAGGKAVTADGTYLHRAIADPRAETVAGYPNIMPTYTQLTPTEIDHLVAYIQAYATKNK